MNELSCSVTDRLISYTLTKTDLHDVDIRVWMNHRAKCRRQTQFRSKFKIFTVRCRAQSLILLYVYKLDVECDKQVTVVVDC